MSREYYSRRRFLASTAAVALGTGLSRAAFVDKDTASRRRPDLGLTDTSNSPFVALRSVGIGEVVWTKGFWSDRFATARDVMVPALWKLMSSTEPTQFLH